MGERLGGYRLEGIAGIGGMGVVYKATEPELSRRVAVKVMADTYSRDPRYRELFREESRRAAALEHPNVLPIYRVGEDQGQLFIGMRFVEGASLQELIDRRGGLPLGLVTRVLQRVADALDAAHAQGLVHRDVKPGNILIGDPGGDEQVYLGDFGLAAAINGPAASGNGTGGGTRAYLAPEQITGGVVDARTDVYALGGVLFHALTGRPPFSAREPLRRRLTQAPPSVAGLVPNLPAGVDAVVARAMAVRPDERFATAGAFGAALGQVRLHAVLVRHAEDAATADVLAERLRAQDLEVRIAGDDPAEDLEAARACLLMIGDGGLGAWARPALEAARATEVVDPGFVLGSILLPGAPDPLRADMAFLLGRPVVDMRGGVDDPHAVPDLLRVLGAAPAGGARAGQAGDRCPYVGLEPFDETDAGFFFGREQAAATLEQKLSVGRFVAVLGASGSGKSSLVRAGLLPRLRGGPTRWRVCTATPGADPLRALAARLGEVLGDAAPGPSELRDDPRALDRSAAAALGPDERLLVLVDQFEEVFSLVTNMRERRAVIDNLVHAATIPAGRVSVVITMRSDFFHRCAEHRDLRTLVAEHQFLAGPMDGRELRRAIEEPAALAGLTMEPGLVRRVVSDVSDHPGALPLMEHLLWELWHRRRGTFLTLEAYEACGGVGGALAKRANTVYRGLQPHQRAIAQRVLLRLVQPAESGEDTRRRAPIAELGLTPEDQRDVEVVVREMSAARLLTTGVDAATGAPTAEVTHEALLRAWPELRGWIEENREELRMHRRLTEAATEWIAGGRDEELLYRGSRLEAWQERPSASLNAQERGFLEASRARAHAELATRRRRVRVAFAALCTGLVMLAGLAAVALLARSQSRDDAAAARLEAARALAAQSRLELSAREGDPFRLAQRSRLEALTPEGDEALRLAAQQPQRRSIPTGHGRIWAVKSLQDGRVATGSEDGQLQVWDLAAPDVPVSSVATGHRSLYVLAQLADGRLVSGNDDGQLEYWDLDEPARPVASVPTKHTSIYAVALATDGRLATGSADGHIQIWDPDRPERPLAAFPSRHTAVNALAWLPDGRLVSGSEDGQVQVWDPTRPERPLTSIAAGHGAIYTIAVDTQRQQMAIGTAAGHIEILSAGPRVRRVTSVRTDRGVVWQVRVLPDGRLAATGGDGVIEIRDPARLAADPVTIPSSHGAIYKADLTPEGVLMTGGDGGQLEVWDVTDLASPVLAARQENAIDAVSRLPDGRVVVTNADGTVGVWDVSGPIRRVVRVRTRRGKANAVAALPDGRFVGATEFGFVHVWDPRRPSAPPLTASLGSATVRGVTVLPGGRVAAVDEDGVLGVWDPAAGRAPVRIRTGQGRMWVVTHLGDGVVATGDDAGRVGIWDTTGAGRRVDLFPTNHRIVFAITLMSDGGIATGSEDGQLQVWDRTRPQAPRVSIATGHNTVFSIVALPDGRLMTGSTDGQIQLWDLADPSRPVASIATAHGAVTGLTVLPDGRAVSGSGDGQLEVRDGTAFTSREQAFAVSARWPLRR